MAITQTTLASAVALTDTVINVASATGITAPNFTTGAGITFLQVDVEFMTVVGVTGTFVSVLRGQNGTAAAAHVVNTTVNIGLPADFPAITEFISRSLTGVQVEGGLNWPAVVLAGTTDAVPAGVAAFYIIRTGSADACTLGLPTLAQEGNIISIVSDTAFAHTVTTPSAAFCHGLTAVHAIATMAALAGAGMLLRVCNLRYHVLSQLGITFS